MIIDSHYEVQEELGKGLWATVYKVKELRTDKIYALKLFHKLKATEIYKKFSAEDMHHITKIQHRNLVHVINFGNHGENLYYIFEYYDGQSLKKFKFISANLDTLYNIIVQICYGLDALHSQKIYHKDLKLNNVLFKLSDKAVELKIMDYGFTIKNVEKVQREHDISLPYLAPEIFLGKEAIPQSDLYSLGVMLYKLTTGIFPFTNEQITKFISGDRQNFFPKFPKEINPEIPDKLENLIIKLLEKNPEDRFAESGEIISYINSIQLKKYSFSQKISIINNIKFSDYIVRGNYAHQLLDFIPLIKKKNGKIVILSAGEGLGKNDILTLFRYHLLTGEFYIFDYECSKINKDPFFALIKEFLNAIKKNKSVAARLQNISGKFRKYLFESEKTAAKMEENEEELRADFKNASDFLFHLAEDKPVIFMIRSAQHITNDVSKFIKFVFKDLVQRPILLIFSLNDPGKIEKLPHSVLINVEALSYEETKKYVRNLLKENPPEAFLQRIWERANGNPMFIENILIDLTAKKIIWQNGKFDFSYDLENYKLPQNIVDSIYRRMEHLSEQHYEYFKLLATVHTPLSKNLIKHILNISEKQIFFLLIAGINNELLKKNENYYFFFTFREVREKFLSECQPKQRKTVARKTIEYFSEKEITRIPILEAVIRHCREIDDYENLRKFTLQLADLYFQKTMFEKAFEYYCKVVEYDFSDKIEVSEQELRANLQLLIQKSEWASSTNISTNLKKYIFNMPDIPEKHIVLGIFYVMMEKFKLAQGRLEKAFQLAITGKQQIVCKLHLAKVYFYQNKIAEVEKCLDFLEKAKLVEPYKIAFIDVKSLYLGSIHKVNEAIELIGNYLANIKSQNNVNFFLKIGSLHNNLAFFYHQIKRLDDAEKNYIQAMKIWEKYKYNRKLVVVYNNIGDVALMKGDTNTAFDYFQKSLTLCNKFQCIRGKIQSLVSFGQAYNKLGRFQTAEKYLTEAFELSNLVENKPFLEAIIDNLAIAKSKIINFSYYKNFIKKNIPDLLKGNIYKITPLTKTYFYFLYHLGDYNRISYLLEKTKTIFMEKKIEEFYHQIYGLIMLQKKDFAAAKENADLAFQYSLQNKSEYAKAINYIRLIEYYLQTDDVKNAYNMYHKSKKLCEKNNFYYWLNLLKIRKAKIQLIDRDISFRRIIRELQEILNYVQSYQLFLLEIEIYEILTQVYGKLKIANMAKLYFERYKNKVMQAVKGLPENDKKIYLKKMQYSVKDYSKLKTIKFVPRENILSSKWQDELYDILKLKELERIKFFIDKTVKKLFSPNFYSIILRDQIKNRVEPFILWGLEKEKLLIPKYLKKMEICLEENQILTRKINGLHTLFIPLRIKTAKIGCLIIADKGELSFQENELIIAKMLRFHLASILMRIEEFSELNKKMELMAKLIEISQSFFTIMDIGKLEQEIIGFVLEYTGGSRGFLIKKDELGNFVYSVAIDESRHLLSNYVNISKSVLGEVFRTENPLFIPDVAKDKFLERFSTKTSDSFSIYCTPLLIDDKFYGFIYIDNYRTPNKHIQISDEFMRLLMIQISVSLKNALQYKDLREKSLEIESLHKLKSKFINIVSHELNTPLSSLKAYMGRLKKMKVEKDENNTVRKISESVDKLYDVTNDIINFSRYSVLKSIEKNYIKIADILNTVYEEALQLSAKRHLSIKLEIEPNLPLVPLNWEAIRLMVKNLVLNAIRFTKDFGNIIIGARHSTFQQEEINGKETLVIYVQDNGIGIPEFELKNIFQSFYEMNDLYSHSSGYTEFRSSGLGLGLTTAQQIALLHGGKIWINSKENEGTTVFVAIPLKQK